MLKKIHLQVDFMVDMVVVVHIRGRFPREGPKTRPGHFIRAVLTLWLRKTVKNERYTRSFVWELSCVT